MRITDKYVFFYGGIFSQWHKVPIQYKGVWFNCAEQAMMYHKALMFGDLGRAEKIMLTDSPKEQKALGRKVFPFVPEEWNEKSSELIIDINYAKFTQHPELTEQMRSMGNRIFVEASPYDKIWGIGMRETDAGVEDSKNWKGQNKLGYCLTYVSQEIKPLIKL